MLCQESQNLLRIVVLIFRCGEVKVHLGWRSGVEVGQRLLAILISSGVRDRPALTVKMHLDGNLIASVAPPRVERRVPCPIYSIPVPS